MRLAFSNIAWDVPEDERVAALLRRHGVNAVDIAPGKYFPRPLEVNQQEISSVRHWWTDQGIEITGMQSLLFGTTGLNVFGSEHSRAAMLAHLAAVCRIGRTLGATRLVFGSPKNRDRGATDLNEAIERAVVFFRQLGSIATSEGVVVCLEPNPPCYGANFMTTSAEAARVVEAVAHPGIRMQLDTGAMTINGEDPEEVVSRFGGLIGHIHASEANLVPIGDGGTDHHRVFRALSQHLPERLVSIEMVATQHEPHVDSIARALQVARRAYCATEGADS